MNRTTLLSDLRLRLFIALLFVVVSTTATWGHDTANPPRANAAVTGRIVDGNGEAVAFASIYIKGTARGATADADGNYYLKVVAGNMTLCASMLGYEEHPRRLSRIPFCRR